MTILNIIILFVLWTIFGSFWWVLISRNWDKNGIKSIFFGRSKCDNCWKTLSPTELIPILSFWLQKGKCKKCGTKLSNFYRIIELICGIIFVITYLLFPHQNIRELVARLIINRWFILLIIVDCTKYELHLPTWILTTIVCLIFSILNQPTKEITISTIFFVSLFLWIYLLSKLYVRLKYKQKWEWFGQWDIYIAGSIGILFPFVFSYHNINVSLLQLVNLALIYIIICCLIWLIYAWIRNKISKKSKEIPFIPPMVFGFWILILFANVFTNILSQW